MTAENADVTHRLEGWGRRCVAAATAVHVQPALI